MHAFLKGLEAITFRGFASTLGGNMKMPATLPSEEFSREFQNRLGQQRFAEGKEAWERLQKLGCDSSILLACVEVLSLHAVATKKGRLSDSYIPEFLTENASLVAEANKLATDVEQNADRIERLNRAPAIFRELLYWKECRPSLPGYMHSYASWLRGVAGKIRSPFSLRDQPGQVRRFASDYVRKVTGKNRVSDLAAILRVANDVVGNNEDVDANSLGKAVRRAHQRLRNSTRQNRR